MTFTRFLLLSALLLAPVQAFLSTPSLKFAQMLQLSRPSHPLKLRNPALCNVRAQMPSSGQEENPAQAIAPATVHDRPDASSILAVGLFTSFYVMVAGGVLFTVASAGNMIHTMVMQPDLSLENEVFAGGVLAMIIGLCYASTALTDLIEISVGKDHWTARVWPERQEFLDAGSGI